MDQLVAGARVGPPNHVVQFYESDDFLCASVARFLVQGLGGNQPLLVIATASHREGIGEKLALHGVDLRNLSRSGHAMLVDARELLSTFQVGTDLDSTRFRRALRDLLDTCRRGRDRVTVRMFGEMVDLLWQDGNHEAALRLEDLSNEAAATESLALLCGYASANFDEATHSVRFEEICRRHARAIPTEHFVEIPDEAGRLRTVALLEQRSRALATELARRERLEGELRRMLSDREKSETERGGLLAREEAAHEQADAASRLRDEFLAVMSHELRTPLNAILGWSQIINRPDGDAATTSRGLEVIQNNARQQLHIIDDLLDMSRLITGKMVIRADAVDLREILREAIEAVRPAISAKAIDLELDTGSFARFITGDRDRLRQVVWNLLSNAIKFTPPQGRIEVRLEDAGAYARIVVRDNGQGIAADFLPYVFDRFRQAQTGTTREHGGLGVGLAVVRQLVEAHGGTVGAVSRGEGCGATFTVNLPVSPGGAQRAGRSGRKKSGPKRSPKTKRSRSRRSRS